jgi:SAM-dependent methyltransferase
MNLDHLYNKYYDSLPEFVDGTTQFHGICEQNIAPGSRILEIGPGPTNHTSQFLAAIGPVTGVDIDDAVLSNTALSAAHVYDGRALPFNDHAFEACVSNYVLEHVADPATHFREAARVLAPGGIYCFRTPNSRHYVSLAARLTPHSIHLLVSNGLRRLPADSPDPYPTYHRANTRSAILRSCDPNTWSVREFLFVEKEPSYGRVSRALFFPMFAYERCVNRLSFLAPLRANIFCTLKKRLGPAL